jgi:AraC-like DNA-binding protein
LDVATGLARYEQARAANLRVLAAASTAQLSRGGVQEGVGRILLRDVPVMMLSHDRSHARELLVLLEEVLPGSPVPPSLRFLASTSHVAPLSPCARRQLSVHEHPDEAGMLPLGRLRELLRSWGSPGSPKMEDVAAVLHMSGRTLQRRLAIRGMTYQCLLDEVRAGLALEYVSAPDAALPDVASRLGYSELRAFLRAFKRWTGLSPAGFRRTARMARTC